MSSINKTEQEHNINEKWTKLKMGGTKRMHAKIVSKRKIFQLLTTKGDINAIVFTLHEGIPLTDYKGFRSPGSWGDVCMFRNSVS